MSQEIIIVVGLPGSGKTTYMSQSNFNDYIKFDNIFAHPDGTSKFLETVNDGKSAIVSDIQFCKSSTLQKFISKIPEGIVVNYHYFSNNPAQCKKNAITRNGRHLVQQLDFIDSHTANYNPIDPYSVWGEIDRIYPTTDGDYYVEFDRGGRGNEFTLFKRHFIRSKEEVEKLQKECPECFPLIQISREGHPWNLFTGQYGPYGCVPDKGWVCWMVNALNNQLEQDRKDLK